MLPVLLPVLGGLVLAGAAGWRVPARPFAPLTAPVVPATRPIPAHLPEVVRRFARALFGAALPDVHSAVVSGRGWLSPFGLPLPSRFRFYYAASSSSYYHLIEATWFTRPVLRIHERNLAGHTRLDLGLIGQVNDQPRTNRAAIQGYWSEVIAWVPAIALTDARVRWEAVDATCARLHLPGLDDAEALTLQFDAHTGLLTTLTTQRYQSESQAQRWPWHNRARAWAMVDGQRVLAQAATQWNDSRPWARWHVEQVALNVDVAARLAQFGDGG
jgi:hypothetical protein